MPGKRIINNLVLELHVPDFKIVKDFYAKLGFEVILEDAVGTNLGYMTMKRSDPLGDTFLNFYGGDARVYKHDYFKDFPKGSKRGYEMEVTIPVNDIETFYQKIEPHLKKEIVQELKLKRWGKKDFRIVDPFGFYLRFTELVDWG